MSMQQEVYEAFRELGVSEDKALKAAAALGRDPIRQDIGDLKRDMVDVKRDIALLKWGQGVNAALTLAVFIKLFVH